MTRIVNVREFLSKKGRRSVGNHQWGWKILHYYACNRCGLVPLKNEATRKAIKAACIVEEDDEVQ